MFGQKTRSSKTRLTCAIPTVVLIRFNVEKLYSPVAVVSGWIAKSLRTLENILSSYKFIALVFECEFVHVLWYQALHAVVSTVKNSIHNKQFTLATFLNKKGAFNNVSVEYIEPAIVDSCRDRSITSRAVDRKSGPGGSNIIIASRWNAYQWNKLSWTTNFVSTLR